MGFIVQVYGPKNISRNFADPMDTGGIPGYILDLRGQGAPENRSQT